MITKFKRRLTLLVCGTLFLIMMGVVATVNLSNRSNLVSQAESALETLAGRDGKRPSLNGADDSGAPSGQAESTPPPVDENGAAPGDTDQALTPPEATPDGPPSGSGSTAAHDPGAQDPGAQNPPAQDPGHSPSGKDPGESARSAGQTSAALSNYYTVRIDHNGTIESWSSDRADLYTDESIADFTQKVLETGNTSGYMDSRYYRLQGEPYGSLLIVLDMQLEVMNARTLLRNTVLIGLGTWILMSIGAVLLIRKMIRPVQEAFDRQRQFVWDAGHELKTPLAVISANADALSRDVGQSEWLDYIHAEIDRASKMLNSMLTLARIDQGAIRAEMKPFDLSRAVAGILLPFESVVFEAGKTLVTDVPEGITYTGDEAMIGQLVSILLGNAVKYADEGGTVTVRLKTAGHRRVLTVHNTGEEISPRDRAHLFERFYRADASHSSKVEGSGLGLAIAKSLVDAHKGHIAVDCPPEGGVLFTVTLP